ncbi:MAG: AtpZ/AtpI family protein [Cytophagales bacterium]|nr:AtpZ/AtpI family protein [Cytophagales bacterium]
MKTDDTPEPKKPRSSSTLSSYARYSGLGFQLIGALLLGYWVGQWLDSYFSSSPAFTVGVTLLFLVASLVKLIAELIRIQQ